MATERFIIREARDEEIPETIRVLSEGFTEDPVNNYMGGVKTKIQETNYSNYDFRALTAFMQWQVFISRMHCDGRIVIALVEVDGKEKIIGGTIWNAPGKRVQFSLKELLPLYRSGTLTLLHYWGWSGIIRMVDYFPRAEAVFKEEWKQRKFTTSIDDTWQCWTAVVLSEYQGKGVLSRLFRAFFAYAPEWTMTLEATSEQSRDKYRHLGFETIGAVHYGKGSTDRMGLIASGEDATGFVVYPMVRWGPDTRSVLTSRL